MVRDGADGIVSHFAVDFLGFNQQQWEDNEDI